MKYMIMLYGSQQDYDLLSGNATHQRPWTEAEISALHDFMGSWNEDLVESGEFVDARGLTAPVHTRRIRLRDGVPVVTDGPYTETQEVLAGYTIVETESFDRPPRSPPGWPRRRIRRTRSPATSGTSTCGRSPDPRRSWSSEQVDAEVEGLLRTLAPQALGAVVRRYGHFDTAEEALLAAAVQWERDGVPDNPKAWLIAVAARRLTDLLRREQARWRREDAVAVRALPDDWLAPAADRPPQEFDDTESARQLYLAAARKAAGIPQQRYLNMRASRAAGR